MPFIGNQPALSYTSFAKQDFTTSATTSYTLDHPVTNENEIALFINFVRQEPTTAYTATGTSLTLTSATSSTDDMYCVFLGKAVQTVNPPSGSVGTAQLGSEAVTNAKLSSSIITGQTAETSIATDDLILLSDTSASGGLRKMTRANFVSGIGGDNTPAFHSFATSGITPNANAGTKVTNLSEVFDTNSAFSSNRFTVPSGEGGKYFFYGAVTYSGEVTSPHCMFFVNGSQSFNSEDNAIGMGSNERTAVNHKILILDAGDYVELFTFNSTGGTNTHGGGRTFFGTYKLIGI
jgi:hypothetical protein